MSTQQSELLIGLDIGGSKTKAACRISDTDSSEIIQVVTHGANLQSVGAAQVAGLIAGLVSRIRLESEFDGVARVVAGVAGAARERDQQEVEQLFFETKTHPDDLIKVVSDAHIALEGAFSGEVGMIVIAGTGSGIYARDRSGQIVRAGGWGPVLGDPASGRNIGLRALRAVARFFDGGPPTDLTTRLAAEFGIADREDLVYAVYRDVLEPSRIAPIVLAAAKEGDAVSGDLLDEEIYTLAREAAWVASGTIESRTVLMGGLCDNALFSDRLQKALRATVPHIRFVEPDAGPELGALRLCRQLS